MRWLDVREEPQGGQIVRVSARKIGAGWHPNQILLAIVSADGTEEFISADKGSWDGSALRVSKVIERRDEDGALLIELPRESESGAWSIWVDSESVHQNAEAA